MLKRNVIGVIAGLGCLRIDAADLRLSAEDIYRYYTLAGIRITKEDAGVVARYTEGWIIAAYLQLCALKETGTISDMPGILSLMEHLVWDALTEEKKPFLLRVSLFETVTARQACTLLGLESLPSYAQETLEIPFIRYEPTARRYELHNILSELLAQKRAARGAAFTHECLVAAGDCCGYEGKTAKAAFPDGLIFPFASYTIMLQGMTDELVEREYPALAATFREVKVRFFSGWSTLHNRPVIRRTARYADLQGIRGC